MTLKLRSIIQCPHCGFKTTERMPVNACIFFYECPACGGIVRPKPGDCCVFCSYGTVGCPPAQQGAGCCDPPGQPGDEPVDAKG